MWKFPAGGDDHSGKTGGMRVRSMDDHPVIRDALPDCGDARGAGDCLKICRTNPIKDILAFGDCLVTDTMHCQYVVNFSGRKFCTRPDWKSFVRQSSESTLLHKSFRNQRDALSPFEWTSELNDLSYRILNAVRKYLPKLRLIPVELADLLKDCGRLEHECSSLTGESKAYAERTLHLGSLVMNGGE